jgi:hypothetical protein
MDIVFYLFGLMGVALIVGNLALTGLAKSYIARTQKKAAGSQEPHEKTD